jgi:hypothetical protein
MEQIMADTERRVELGFEGGLILVVRLPDDQWAKLEGGLGAGGHVSLTGEDTTYVIDTSKVCYVKVEDSVSRIGF